MTADELIEKAKDQRKRGRLEEALISARQASTLDSQNADAFWQIALCQIELGPIANAVAPLEEVVKLAPRFARGWSRLGLALLQAEENERPLQALFAVSRARCAWKAALRQGIAPVEAVRHCLGIRREHSDACVEVCALAQPIARAGHGTRTIIGGNAAGTAADSGVRVSETAVEASSARALSQGSQPFGESCAALHDPKPLGMPARQAGCDDALVARVKASYAQALSQKSLCIRCLRQPIGSPNAPTMSVEKRNAAIPHLVTGRMGLASRSLADGRQSGPLFTSGGRCCCRAVWIGVATCFRNPPLNPVTDLGSEPSHRVLAERNRRRKRPGANALVDRRATEAGGGLDGWKPQQGVRQHWKHLSRLLDGATLPAAGARANPKSRAALREFPAADHRP